MQTTAKNISDVPAINRFLSYCRVRTVPSKNVMIHAGDLPDVLYYIVDGSVEVMIEDEDGNEMVLAYLNKGQFFGEMGLFYEQPTRSAWVRTRTECEIAEMTYSRSGGIWDRSSRRSRIRSGYEPRRCESAVHRRGPFRRRIAPC